MWETVGANIARGYRGYPRLVGETGGKDFILAHPSADAEAVATAVVRGSFEYQGQKCSAASRLYVPSNLWPEVKERLVADVESIRMGDAGRLRELHGRGDRRERLQDARGRDRRGALGGAEILTGGDDDDSEGYFVEPTVIRPRTRASGSCATSSSARSSRPTSTTRSAGSDTLELVDETAPYALTGAVFADGALRDRGGPRELRYSAGNFYVNDKPTGAVVGQQPFGGSRASGTNDKAGSMWNLIRWVRPRTVKETFVPPTDYRYPFLAPGRPTASRSAYRGRMGDRAPDAIAVFLDQLGSVDFLPLALAIGAHLLKMACTSRAGANVARGLVPEEPVPWLLDLRRLSRRRRDQRDHPRARRRRRPHRPRAPRRSRAARTRRSSRALLVLSFFDMFAASSSSAGR